VPSLKSIGENFKLYGMVAAGGLGLTGSRAPSGPLHAQVGICDPCNHECVFCWDHPPDDRASADTADRFGGARPGVMSIEMFRGIVDDLFDLGTRRIDLIGRGEPFLNRAALDMVRYVKGRGMHMQIVTNGSRLFEPIAKGLVAARTDRLNVSLNAGTPETYPHIHVTETAQDYLKVKRNLRGLADCKIAAGSDAPFISLSFVITAKNYFEVEQMIEVTHEVGAQQAQFAHAVLHGGTQDLALSEAQLKELQEHFLPAARARARALGVANLLHELAVTTPSYMPSELVGPVVVPCYTGWYFTVILANGSVMPCCQCATAIGQVTKDRRLADIWASREYGEFRVAARALPTKSDKLDSCECDNCALRPRNIALHNFIHPLNKIPAGEEVQRFTAGDFMRKIRGQLGHAPE
jgi:MoaA/NifB/PqqE/SkfB family radical SAM enzyme